MKFINTNRFSPVAELGDLPWEYDLFHHKVDALPPTKKELDEFVAKNNLLPDVGWWHKQKERCLNGYWVPDAIERGGDVFVDGSDCIWNDSAKPVEYSNGVTIPPESVYMPEYDLVIDRGAVWIPGRFYWYLNFWIIYGLKKGAVIKSMTRPRFLDIDYGFFHRVNLMFKRSKEDLQETKTRQLGFSLKMSSLVGYNFTHIPASMNVIAGGMGDDAEKTFQDTLNGLDSLRNTQFYRQRSINRVSDFRIRAANGGSEVQAISCKDNAQALSRFSPYLVILEEMGKWQKGLVSEAKQFIEVSLRSQGQKTGYTIGLGTGGDMEMGAADLEKMHYNPEENNLLRFKNKWEREPVDNYSAHFTPGWQYTIIDDHGNSLKEKSIEYMKKQEDLIKDPQKLYVYRTQNANFAADVFQLTGGLFFGPTIANWVNERKAQIMIHKDAQRVKRYNIRWKRGIKNWREGVVMDEDPKGAFLISELPRTYKDDAGRQIVYRDLYKAATDSYDQDEAKTSSSKGSCWIKKGFLNSNETYSKYVAGVYVRPEIYEGGRDAFYEYTALLCVAYGNAINLIESRNLLIFEWYHRNGMTALLKERPGILISKYIKNSLQSNVYGIDPMFKPHALKILKDFLGSKVNIMNIDHLEILEAIVKYKLHKDYNCDITVSLAYLETLMEDEANIVAKKSEEEMWTPPKFRMLNGEIVKV
jgi:hypothetical protein